MVNYAEEADFVGRARPRKHRSPKEIAERRAARAAERSEDDWRSYARDLCFRQLGMMERSVDQLRKSMEKNLVPAEIIEETLDSFQNSNLVNDERYAGMYVRSKFNEKATSRRALRQELRRKGIDQEVADEALLEIDDEAETRAAMDFAMRKARSMRSLEYEVARRRLYGALARRGFSPDQIRQAVGKALANDDPEESEDFSL